MTKNIWIISDTHFNHEQMMYFRDWSGNLTRPGFTDVNDMNEYMIDNWNSVVKDGDEVWHLGDVVFGDDKVSWMENNFYRLNGEKHLVVGNHDNIEMMCGYKWFTSVNFWKHFKEHNILCSHVPLHQGSLLRPTNADGKTSVEDLIWEETLNVHGHIHSNPSPDGPYKCVCVEQTNYTPINIEELV